MRKFGLEVEFAGNPQAALDKLRAEGLTTDTSIHSYTGNSNTHWVVKRDSSVANGGGELVGPPLDWDNPDHRGQIKRALQCLIDAGCNSEPTAGIHVHIDANDMTGKQIAGAARTFTKFEDQIYRIATSGWREMRSNYRWCKPMSRQIIEKLAKAQTREQLSYAWYGSRDTSLHGHSHSSRYHGFNLHSWFFRGTIEFRIFNSSLNWQRVEAYVVLCMAIVQDGRDGKMRSINRIFELGQMKNGVLTEKKAFHHLCQFLRWENETSPISKEDLDLIRLVWKNSVPQSSVYREAM